MHNTPYIYYTNGIDRSAHSDALSFIAKLHNVAMVTDRFGYLNKYSIWNLDPTIKDIPVETTENFSDILDKEIQKVLDLNEDVYVSWSGGIDSSCILCGFLNSDMDLTKLHVIYSDVSIEDFPSLYDKLISLNVDLIKAASDTIESIYEESLSKGVLCTGWHGDQLYGRWILQMHPSIANMHWKDACFYLGASDAAVSQLEEAFKFYNLNIETGAQFCWWQGFFTCWYERAGSEYILGKGYDDKVIDIFGSEAFQSWSITRYKNKELLADTSSLGCKPEMKDYIYSVVKDAQWRDSRIKSSIGPSVFINKPMLFIVTSEGLIRIKHPTKVHPARYHFVFTRLSQDYLPRYKKDSSWNVFTNMINI